MKILLNKTSDLTLELTEKEINEYEERKIDKYSDAELFEFMNFLQSCQTIVELRFTSGYDLWFWKLLIHDIDGSLLADVSMGKESNISDVFHEAFNQLHETASGRSLVFSYNYFVKERRKNDKA